MNDQPTHSCQRCGVCCEKGGPSLHREDRRLVDDGQIPARCLFTLRQGELARDDIRGTLAPLPAEIIKIKGRDGRWTCQFYDRRSRGCTIYGHRPLECRVLDCRDTRKIEMVYDTDRLTRKDLLASVQGLWELIEDHERHCSYAELDRLVRQGGGEIQPPQEAAILEMLRFDAHIRQLTVEKAGLDAGMLDFIFGRALSDTIGMFGLKLEKLDDTYRLTACGRSHKP
jgi:Fe-S-cluster containining protein